MRHGLLWRTAVDPVRFVGEVPLQFAAAGSRAASSLLCLPANQPWRYGEPLWRSRAGVARHWDLVAVSGDLWNKPAKPSGPTSRGAHRTWHCHCLSLLVQREPLSRAIVPHVPLGRSDQGAVFDSSRPANLALPMREIESGRMTNWDRCAGVWPRICHPVRDDEDDSDLWLWQRHLCRRCEPIWCGWFCSWSCCAQY